MSVLPVCFTTREVGASFRQGMTNAAAILQKPQAIVDVSAIIGSILAYPCLSSRYFKLLVACEFAQFTVFFANFDSMYRIFYPYSVETLNLSKLIKSLKKECADNDALLLNSLCFLSDELKALNQHKDRFKTKEELVTYFVKAAASKNVVDLALLDWELKPLTFLETFTRRSWLCGSLSSTASSVAVCLQGLDLLGMVRLVNSVGNFGLLAKFLVPIEAWTNAFNMAGYCFQCVDSYQKMNNQKLTPEERREARLLMLCSAGEAMLSFGTVLTIAWLGPVSYAVSPLLVTTRRITLVFAKSFDLCYLVNNYVATPLESEIKLTELRVAVK